MTQIQWPANYPRLTATTQLSIMADDGTKTGFILVSDIVQLVAEQLIASGQIPASQTQTPTT